MDKEEILKLLTLRKSFEELKTRQREILKRYPELLSEAKKLRRIRERSVGNEELLKDVIEAFQDGGINVILAKNSDDAIAKVLELIGNERLVVKSKTNVGREIGLTEKLCDAGISVIETDVGDRILQILNELPSHPTGPAAHLSASIIAKGLSSYFGFNVQPSAEEIVRIIKSDISDKLRRATVGICGANAITREGAIVLLHNEGNISKILTSCEKVIVITGIDKIYPNIESAMTAAKIQSVFAAGIILPSFVEIVCGTAKTADVEKRLVKEGKPKEIHLLLVDNGRRELIGSGFAELFYCIGCGNCVVNCPSHSVHGSKFYGGRFALIDALRGEGSLDLCLTCGRCRKNCPLEIDIPAMVRAARKSNLKGLVISHVSWLLSWLEIEAFRLTRL